MLFTIQSGANLQTAINALHAGDILEVDALGTFTGNFTLPTFSGTEPITIRTSTLNVQFPSDKVGPEHAPLMPTLRSMNTQPVLKTLGSSSHWRLIGLRFVVNNGADIVQIGDTAITDAAQVPSDIIIDRCIILAETTGKRGIQLNGADVTVKGCHISGIKIAGQETQAIDCWNGPGPFLIEDNHIEAGAIGVLFGGAAPSIPNLVPSGITFRRNLVTRPLAMKGQNRAVKNLFELKNARNVVVNGNIFENNWPGSQAGWSIVFTVRAQTAAAPWSTIENVAFTNNIVRHVSMGFNILGRDDAFPSGVMNNVVIANNLCYDIDHTVWGGSGAWIQVGGGPNALVISSNTVIQTGNTLSLNGVPITGFQFTHNIARHNTYGIFGDAVGTGNPAIARYVPGAIITGNVLAGGNPAQYSSVPGNLFPTLITLMGNLENPTNENYRLKQDSTFRTLPDGMPGVDQDALALAMVPPAPPAPPTVQERIQTVVDEELDAVEFINGDVSPQSAAYDAINRLHAAILEVL
jgi:hypothetical protein